MSRKNNHDPRATNKQSIFSQPIEVEHGMHRWSKRPNHDSESSSSLHKWRKMRQIRVAESARWDAFFVSLIIYLTSMTYFYLTSSVVHEITSRFYFWFAWKNVMLESFEHRDPMASLCAYTPVLFRCIGDLSTLQCKDTPKQRAPWSLPADKSNGEVCVRNPKEAQSTLMSRATALDTYVGMIVASWVAFFTRNERDLQVVGSRASRTLLTARTSNESVSVVVSGTPHAS